MLIITWFGLPQTAWTAIIIGVGNLKISFYRNNVNTPRNNVYVCTYVYLIMTILCILQYYRNLSIAYLGYRIWLGKAYAL